MPVNGYDVFDGDGHVLEDTDELIRYYEGDYAGRTRLTALGLFPGLDGWSRGAMIGKEDSNRKYWHTDAAVWAECLADIGADGTVLYPTAALAHGLMRDVPFAVATAIAYNNWLEDRYTRPDDRLRLCRPIPPPVVSCGGRSVSALAGAPGESQSYGQKSRAVSCRGGKKKG